MFGRHPTSSQPLAVIPGSIDEHLPGADADTCSVIADSAPFCRNVPVEKKSRAVSTRSEMCESDSLGRPAKRSSRLLCQGAVLQARSERQKVEASEIPEEKSDSDSDSPECLPDRGAFESEDKDVNFNIPNATSRAPAYNNSCRASRCSFYHRPVRHETIAAAWKVSFRAVLIVLLHRIAPYCKDLIKSYSFQGTMFLALLAALFFPDLWVLMERPSNNDLDIILTTVLAAFLFELVVQSFAFLWSYIGQFFFWLDLVGALSLLLDLSYLNIQALLGDGTSGYFVMRIARIVKLGARAVRCTRLAKNVIACLPALPKEGNAGGSGGAAKIVSAKLIASLSMRVSGLIIIMVSVMPFRGMLTYPGEDYSIDSWRATLEAYATSSSPTAGRFARQLERFEHFYREMNYYPLRVELQPGAKVIDDALTSLPWAGKRPTTRRPTNIHEINGGVLLFKFNMAQTQEMDALMSIFLLIFVISLMIGFTLVLSNTVSYIVLRPLEKLLRQVHQTAHLVFNTVSREGSTEILNEGMNGDEKLSDGAFTFQGEIDLLEKVVRRLAIMGEKSSNRRPSLDSGRILLSEDRALLNSFGGVAYASEETCQDNDRIEEEKAERHVESQRQLLEGAGLSLDLLNSWNLNPLELDTARNHAAAVFFLGPCCHDMPFGTIEMESFLGRIEAGYKRSNPFHNWYHAVDVTHCAYRLTKICVAEEYLYSTDNYGLLVSAVAHDIGHPGYTNAFLIETSHSIALRYNDLSPLENMHCATLFEILSQPNCNIFGKMVKYDAREVRKICIEAILYTDFARHFVLNKEVQMCLEVHSERFQEARTAYRHDKDSFPDDEVLEALRKQDTRRLLACLFLHVADLGYCMKPFRICRIWATQVIEEYFTQGDHEKKIGIPVQALNDRQKVNRAFSQIGFIEFMVCPLMFSATRVLPPMQLHTEQVILNAKTWHQHWLKDANQSEDDVFQLEDRIARLQNRYFDYCANIPDDIK